ncbi:hypothetical protein BH09ACT4_BH09ACT4_00990 [soil metagenome]
MNDFSESQGYGPVTARCVVSWLPRGVLRALVLRDSYQLRLPEIEIPPLSAQSLHPLDDDAPIGVTSRLTIQWIEWWKSVVTTDDLSILVEPSDGPRDVELSHALEHSRGRFDELMTELGRRWNDVRTDLDNDLRSPRWPVASGGSMKNPRSEVVRIAVVPTEVDFASELAPSVFATSWQMALDRDRFADWIRPALHDAITKATGGGRTDRL